MQTPATSDAVPLRYRAVGPRVAGQRERNL